MRNLRLSFVLLTLAVLVVFGVQTVQAFTPPQIQANVQAAEQQQEVTTPLPPVEVTAEVDITTNDDGGGGGINTTWLIIIILVVLILVVGIALGTGRHTHHVDD